MLFFFKLKTTKIGCPDRFLPAHLSVAAYLDGHQIALVTFNVLELSENFIPRISLGHNFNFIEN